MENILPVKLYLYGSYEEIVNLLYTIFNSDIKLNDLRYKGLPIIFDNRIGELNYEEGFWHLITSGKEARLLDFKRAKRLPWLKPIIENINSADLLKWIEYDIDRKGKKVKKTYIWYRSGKYLIVLKEIPNKYFLTTAFYVNNGRNDDYYWKKYIIAKKKGPDC